MKARISHFIFILIIILVSVFYGYQDIIFKRPQSIHKWRQADCASIALNYYQNGMHFFAPEVNNLTSDGGTTGKCMTSEIPIIYYSSAILYKVFGYHDYLYRSLNTILFLLGLFYLFKTFLILTKDTFWSVILTLAIFSSPVLVYYGNNFLSNSTAFAFTLIGWYFFIQFLLDGKIRKFYIAVLIFLIAAAFKVTALFSLLAISGVYLAEWIQLKKETNILLLFKNKLQFILPVFLTLLIIGSWLLYANYYNKIHGCTYFSTTIFPIWNYDKESILVILNQIYATWGNQYFHSSVYVLLAVILVGIFIQSDKKSQFLKWIIFFLFIEEIAYFMLQFWTFRDHDYYTIDMFILPVLILLAGIQTLKQNYPNLFYSLWLKAAITLLVCFNLFHARTKLIERYSDLFNNYKQTEDLYTITPYLRSIGISPNDTVISIPDDSHVSLYLMNQKGWTEYTDQKFNRGEPYRYNADSLAITESIKKGAAYMIVNGLEELYKKPYLQSFCNFLVGHYNNVLIFRLNKTENNFSLKMRQIKETYSCDAEVFTPDSLIFTNQKAQLFENATTRSKEFALSGKYSIRLEETHPFGMTIRFNNLQKGESFRISAWRKKSAKEEGFIITSSEEYYNNDFTIVNSDSLGWEKLEKELFISTQLENKELTIYLYNPGKSAAYFDNLLITRFYSYNFSISEKDN